MYPGRREDRTDAGGFLAARRRSCANPARKFRQGGARWSKNVIWHRCRRMRLWDQRKAVRVHGEVRNDADAGDSGGDLECGGSVGTCERVRLDQGGKVCGFDCSEWRSAKKHQLARERGIRDERWKGL